jgi:hypothetical protein
MDARNLVSIAEFTDRYRLTMTDSMDMTELALKRRGEKRSGVAMLQEKKFDVAELVDCMLEHKVDEIERWLNVLIGELREIRTMQNDIRKMIKEE